MTTPDIYNSRVTNVIGGYKQIGKTVYVDVVCTLNATLSNTQSLPRLSYWEMLSNLPKASHNNSPLNITYWSNNDTRPVLSQAYMYQNQDSLNSSIYITGASSYTFNTGDTFHIRGTYEAQTSI